MIPYIGSRVAFEKICKRRIPRRSDEPARTGIKSASSKKEVRFDIPVLRFWLVQAMENPSTVDLAEIERPGSRKGAKKHVEETDIVQRGSTLPTGVELDVANVDVPFQLTGPRVEEEVPEKVDGFFEEGGEVGWDESGWDEKVGGVDGEMAVR